MKILTLVLLLSYVFLNMLWLQFWFTFSLAVNLHDVWSPPNKSGERFSGTFEPRITGSAYLETTEGKVLFLVTWSSQPLLEDITLFWDKV